MKKKIGLVLCVVLLCVVCFGLGFWFNNKTQNKQTESSMNNPTGDEGLIKTPDRIIFKYESKYYEITPDYEKYSELVDLCRNNINRKNDEVITENDIDSLKSTAKFIEFDYNTISKNFIFNLTSDVGAIQMRDSDGVVISSKLSNIDKIGEAYTEAIKDKTGYDMSSEKFVSMNEYTALPSVADFRNVKNEKVYVKVFDSYADFNGIASRYNLKFDNADSIEGKFENRKGILILSQYDVKSYKVNVGNVKVRFSGNDYEVPATAPSGYIADLILVSKIVNTDCIYYNYDDVAYVDNLTGTTESISGVVKSKDADEITIAYEADEYSKELGRIMISSSKLMNKTADEVQVGDFVSGTVTVTGKDNDIKLYEAESLSVQDKDEYNSLLENELKGKTRINTNIVWYHPDENGYSGSVVCALYYGENSSGPDAYFSAGYDFYDRTESYLGNADRPLATDYGIVPYEIVDVTFTEPVTDVNRIFVKSFEYIAD